MVRYYFIFIGRVVHVGFRYKAVMYASKHNITGYIRNMDNDNVELVAQGKSEDVFGLLNHLREPDYFIRIDDYSAKELPVIENETEFKVKG